MDILDTGDLFAGGYRLDTDGHRAYNAGAHINVICGLFGLGRVEERSEEQDHRFLQGQMAQRPALNNSVRSYRRAFHTALAGVRAIARPVQVYR